MSSSIEVKEIVYHCHCRRFVEGPPAAPCFCAECGREYTPACQFTADGGE